MDQLVELEPATTSETDISHAMVRMLRMVNRMRVQLCPPGERGEWSAFRLLVPMMENGPQRLSAIADAAHSDASTVSRQIAHMVDSGLVERRADPADGRASLLAITKAGERLVARQRATRARFLTGLLADWPERDRHRFATLLHRFVDDMEAAISNPTTQSTDETNRSETR